MNQQEEWIEVLPKRSKAIIEMEKIGNSTKEEAKEAVANHSKKIKKFVSFDEVNLNEKEILALDCNLRQKEDMIFKNDLRNYFSDYLGYKNEPRLLLLENDIDNYKYYNNGLLKGYSRKRPNVGAEFAGHFIGDSAFKWSAPFRVFDQYQFDGLVSEKSRYLLDAKSTLYPRGNDKLKGLYSDLAKAKQNGKNDIKKKIENIIKDLVVNQARILAFKVNTFARDFDEELPIRVALILKEYDEKEEKQYLDLFIETFLNRTYTECFNSLTLIHCESEALKEFLVEMYNRKSQVNEKAEKREKQEKFKELTKLVRKVVPKLSASEKEEFQKLVNTF